MREIITVIVVFLLVLAVFSLRQTAFGGAITILGFIGFVLWVILYSFLNDK